MGASSKGRATGQIAAAFLIWSSWGVFIRLSGMPGWLISFYIGVIACAAALLLRLVRGGPNRFFPPEKFWTLFLMGAIFLVNNVLYLTAFDRTTVANALFSHYAAPVLVALGAPLLIGEKPLKTMPFAVFMAMAGMWLLMPGIDFDLSDNHFIGIAAGLGSAFAYAALVMMARVQAPSVEGAAFIFYLNLVVSLGLAPWAAMAPAPTGGQWALLVMLGLVHAVVAPLLYLDGLRTITAQAGSVIGYFEPLGGVILAAVFLGEVPPVWGLAGGALILSGGGLTIWEESKG